MLNIESYLNQKIEQACQKLNFPKIIYQFDRPKLEAHGDISINLAMLLAKETAAGCTTLVLLQLA